jgi:hypothetical protein
MKLSIYIFVLFAFGCTSSTRYTPNMQQLDSSQLPLPDVTVSIPNLSSCTDSDDNAIHINSAAPITILVHGCNGSSGRFRSLAQLYAFHGQQAICFNYDDRDSLVDIAEKLAISIGELAEASNNQNISILGHSMGGLIARKALEPKYEDSYRGSGNKLELITVSAPFAGIESAEHCGIRSLHWLSLGVLPSLCWIITGDNWFEITSSSSFIKHPQSLIPGVQRYLKVVTNEANTCRRVSSDGKCLESDDIFGLSEQYQADIDSYHNVVGVQVDAGHVEIVGDKHVAPRKLLAILQENGMLSYTQADRIEELEKLLADLY